MNKQYEQVRDLHKAFCVKIPDKPTLLNGALNKNPLWYAHELERSMKAMKNDSAKGNGGEVLTRSSYILEELIELLRAETIEEQSDALIDIMYFVLGTFTLMGVKPEKLFDIVQAANMGKLWEDGLPRFDEQMKWIKPPGWKERHAPEAKIREEIKRQSCDRVGGCLYDLIDGYDGNCKCDYPDTETTYGTDR